MWEEDITDLINHIKSLRENGVKDFNVFFEKESNIRTCIKKIKILNVNEATLNLHKAKSKEQLINNLSSLFTTKSIKAFKTELLAIARGETTYQSITEAKTFDNNIINLSLHINITTRTVNNEVRYFSLISTIDITKQKQYENELKSNEKALRSILDTSQDVALLVDTKGFILESNKACQDLFGVSRTDIIGRKLIFFAEKSSIKEHSKGFLKAVKEKRKISFKNEAYGKHWITTISPLLDKSGKVEKVVIFHRDVTKEFFDEKRVKESEEKFRVLAELAPVAISIFKNAEIADYLYVNSAWEKLSGYTRKDLKNIKPIDFVHPDMRDFVLKRARKRLAGENEPSRYEIKAVTKKGEVIWIDFTAIVIEYNNSPAILNSAVDITNQKNTEEKLKEINEKLRNLSKYMNKVREEERKIIAREIHDNLGQKLTALNLDISWIQEKIPNELTEIKNAFDPILELIEKTIETVQKLSTELRPGILDDLGLNNAIQWQTNEISRRTSIKFDLDISPKEPKLNEEIKIALFRVYQEAITNIIRHSKAKTVSVILNYKNKNISFIIKDDGIGISSEKIEAPNSYGIIGIKERITAIDGEVDFENVIPTGTLLKIKVPYTEDKR